MDLGKREALPWGWAVSKFVLPGSAMCAKGTVFDPRFFLVISGLR